MVDEHSSSEDLPYRFNGKEMDEETGFYYYGKSCEKSKCLRNKIIKTLGYVRI